MPRKREKISLKANRREKVLKKSYVNIFRQFKWTELTKELKYINLISFRTELHFRNKF